MKYFRLRTSFGALYAVVGFNHALHGHTVYMWTMIIASALWFTFALNEHERVTKRRHDDDTR